MSRTTTKAEKKAVRNMLRSRHGDGCRPQIDKEGGCSIWRAKGNGTHMRNGEDLTVGRIFMGWDTDLIEEVSNA